MGNVWEIGISLVAENRASGKIEDVESSLLDLDNKQGQVASSTDEMSRQTEHARGAFGDMSNAVTGVIAGYLTMRGAQEALKFEQFGEDVSTATANFTQLAGGVDSAYQYLDAMHQATGNTVTDFELMQQGSKLLLMGLVDNETEMGKFVSIATRLGGAVGLDANTALETLSLTISNMSYQRLDNLGIASSKVRDEVKKLTDAGMDMNEAFKTAVLKQGADAVDKLGDAADKAFTPVDRLLTRLENVKNTFASQAADTINSAITAAEQMAAIPGLRQQMLDQQQAQAQDFVNNEYNTITQLLSNSTGMDWQSFVGKDRDTLAQAIADVFNQSLRNIDADTIAKSLSTIPDAFRGALVDNVQFAMSLEQTTSRLQDVNDQYKTWEKTQFDMAALAVQQGALNYGSAPRGIGALVGVQDVSDISVMRDGIEDLDHSFSHIQITAENMRPNPYIQQFEDFMAQAGSVGDFAFQDSADAIADKFHEIQALGEQGLISQEDVDKARQLADQSQQAADNLKNMSLTTALGQTSGGMAGQMSDQVIAAMRKAGKSDAEIQAAQQAMDMASGRETGASQAFAQEAAAIAQMSPEDQAKAIENMTSFLQFAKQSGFSDQQTAALLPGSTGFAGGPGQAFTVKPGQTLSEISASTGIPVDQLLAATGAPNARSVMPGSYNMGGYSPIGNFSEQGYIQSMMGAAGLGTQAMGGEDTTTMSQNLQDMVEPASTINTQFGDIKSSTAGIVDDTSAISAQLDALTAQSHIIDVELNVTNSAALIALLGGAGITPSTGTGSGSKNANRDQGGQPPGVDSRTKD